MSSGARARCFGPGSVGSWARAWWRTSRGGEELLMQTVEVGD